MGTLTKLVYSFVFALVIGLSAIAQAADTPTDQLKSTIDSILELLGKNDMDNDQRREKLRALINSRFDFRTMSQQTLAVNWRKANNEQQDKFVDLFSQLLEQTYIGRIEAYTNEKVQFVDEKIKDDRAQVNTLIVTGSVDIPINYRLLPKDGKWLVYDVIIEEVSLIRNYRTSYQDVVKKSGIDGLLVEMQAKVEELKNTPAPAPKT